MATTDFIAAIELSSSKIAGIVGKKNSDGSLQVLAYAREESASFVHKGVIYNIDKTAQAITTIVGKLEAQLDNKIAKVYVSIGGQSLRTVKNMVNRSLDEETKITQELVDSICDENLNAPLVDMEVLGVSPQEFIIDNMSQIDPVGVTGRNIIGQFQNIVARASLRKYLEQSFGVAKVEIADQFIAPVVLAKAVLNDNDMRTGCALVDFGADTTTISVYLKNVLRFLCVLPLGGNTITRDLTNLQIEETEAEKLKIQYGDALYEELREENEAPAVCKLEDGRTIEIAKLNEVIGARATEILSNVKNLLDLSGYKERLLAGVIFTGGGSNLKNLDAAYRKLTKIEKLKNAKFVHETVFGYSDVLKKDGSVNLLLALLGAGHENCCMPESEPEAINPPVDKKSEEEIAREQELKRQEEEAKKRKEEAAAAAALAEQKRLEEEAARQQLLAEQKKREEAAAAAAAAKKKRKPWWKEALGTVQSELFSEDDMK